ncbi:RNase H domain-containing protein [Trichonephila clavipes]|nr:RNase H domain-containing protein [Trichonephila clavipes]
MNSDALTYSELHSTYINNKRSTVPPAHHWYEAKRPGGSLFLQYRRQEQTILTRFQSGHLRTLTFRDGNKVFPTCERGQDIQFPRSKSGEEMTTGAGTGPIGVAREETGDKRGRITTNCTVALARVDRRFQGTGYF